MQFKKAYTLSDKVNGLLGIYSNKKIVWQKAIEHLKTDKFKNDKTNSGNYVQMCRKIKINKSIRVEPKHGFNHVIIDEWRINK